MAGCVALYIRKPKSLTSSLRPVEYSTAQNSSFFASRSLAFAFGHIPSIQILFKLVFESSFSSHSSYLPSFFPSVEVESKPSILWLEQLQGPDRPGPLKPLLSEVSLSVPGVLSSGICIVIGVLVTSNPAADRPFQFPVPTTTDMD